MVKGVPGHGLDFLSTPPEGGIQGVKFSSRHLEPPFLSFTSYLPSTVLQKKKRIEILVTINLQIIIKRI